MRLTLHSRTHITGNVWAYEFIPSAPVSWTAGQFVKIEVPHAASDLAGTKRFFTIAAAPHEQVIRVATRLTASTFKQALHALPVGGRITLIDPPAGDFVWREWPIPHVFVAQGIGITPYLAILTDRVQRGLPIPAQLYFANRAGDAPFLDNLTTLANSHPEFKIYTSSAPYTPSRLAKLVPDLASATVYVSGPGSYFKLLVPPTKLPTSQLVQDNFPNYAAEAY